jgi:hypothetical protein
MWASAFAKGFGGMLIFVAKLNELNLDEYGRKQRRN